MSGSCPRGSRVDDEGAGRPLRGSSGRAAARSWQDTPSLALQAGRGSPLLDCSTRRELAGGRLDAGAGHALDDRYPAPAGDITAAPVVPAPPPSRGAALSQHFPDWGARRTPTTRFGRLPAQHDARDLDPCEALDASPRGDGSMRSTRRSTPRSGGDASPRSSAPPPRRSARRLAFATTWDEASTSGGDSRRRRLLRRWLRRPSSATP